MARHWIEGDVSTARSSDAPRRTHETLDGTLGAWRVIELRRGNEGMSILPLDPKDVSSAFRLCWPTDRRMSGTSYARAADDGMPPITTSPVAASRDGHQGHQHEARGRHKRVVSIVPRRSRERPCVFFQLTIGTVDQLRQRSTTRRQESACWLYLTSAFAETHCRLSIGADVQPGHPERQLPV
jgi:hypothetical protein